MNFKIESVMEGKCEKSGMQISLYFMRRGREFMEIYVIVQTLSCSISVADAYLTSKREGRTFGLMLADIKCVSCTYNAASLTANEIIPVIVLHGLCTKRSVLLLNMQR